MDSLTLNIPGFTFPDLFDPLRLAELDRMFCDEVKEKDPDLHGRFSGYRDARGAGLPPAEVSALLLAMAPHVASFVARMFGVQDACREMQLRAEREKVILVCKREFFIRRALKKISREQAMASDLREWERKSAALRSALPGIPRDDPELETAAAIVTLLDHERFGKTVLPEASRLFAAALADRLKGVDGIEGLLPAAHDEPSLRLFLLRAAQAFEQWLAALYYRGGEGTRDWVLFKLPHQIDYRHLVDVRVLNEPVPDCIVGPPEQYRRREGFDLTDLRFPDREVMSEADYCIYCHERDKDSCSKGLREGNGFRKNPLGYPLKGCPLEQKISESQLLKAGGDSLAALAVIMIDNPMVPGTGHRICNDCMKACIYQKQDPVNIPQIETRILTDVLDLPWGFEIYSLLTRWNPMNVERPCALPYNGRKILIVGMGPAGYTLAHYFLNEGFGVVGIDGLKIEPLPVPLVGDAATLFAPLRDFQSVASNLSDRVMMGFGGVSEYGITVRWDKNFLTVIYLNLMRRQRFRLYDGVRFGGTLTVEDAWGYGFDHVCVGTGAGKPVLVAMNKNLIRGVRKASDFLMALQLTGAGKRQSLANLQVRLPAVVIGGGLTAIDTATELMAYYPVQVAKITDRYMRLVARHGKERTDTMFDRDEKEALDLFLQHAHAIACERERAERAGERPDFIPLLRKWGGVQIYYRKGMFDSPAYRLNHEEIIKSLQEGISFVEKMNPLEAVPDEFGAVRELVFEKMEQEGGKWKGSGRLFHVPARAVLVAAGTVPNVMYEREHPGTFALDEKDEFFQTFSLAGDAELKLVKSERTENGFFTSYVKDGRYVSFFGDNHPEFAGNVVKAMASAKLGYKAVLALFGEGPAATSGAQGGTPDWAQFTARLDDDLKARVVEVNRLTPTITEVIVRAPKAAREFHPGQFYRLQNYEVDSPTIDGTLLLMEGVALTGAWVDKNRGLISLIVLEVGASSRLCALLRPGQRVVVMGPTGCPTEITENGTVILLGGGLGNAVLFSIAKAFREKNNRVIYFAGYRRREDLFKREEIEASTDLVVYSVDAGVAIDPQRPQDKTFVGNIVQAMVAYAGGDLGPIPVPLVHADRIIAIGSDRMMAAVTEARHGVLAPYLNREHVGIASINSPMQCMMKAICAQCLQRHVDPATGREEFVFSCANQDQLMDEVDFSNLSARLRVNTVMEKLSNRWLDDILERNPLPRV